MTTTIYVRTLVFSLVLSVACVGMLWMSTLAVLKPYAYFWLTLAVGTLLVVINTIVSVYQYQRQVTDLMNNTVNNSVSNTCPDYWTLDTSSKQCTGSFVTPDNKYTFVIGTQPPNSPVTIGSPITPASCTPQALSAQSSYPYEYMKEMCRAVNMGSAIPS